MRVKARRSEGRRRTPEDFSTNLEASQDANEGGDQKNVPRSLGQPGLGMLAQNRRHRGLQQVRTTRRSGPPPSISPQFPARRRLTLCSAWEFTEHVQATIRGQRSHPVCGQVQPLGCGLPGGDPASHVTLGLSLSQAVICTVPRPQGWVARDAQGAVFSRRPLLTAVCPLSSLGPASSVASAPLCLSEEALCDTCPPITRGSSQTWAVHRSQHGTGEGEEGQGHALNFHESQQKGGS